MRALIIDQGIDRTTPVAVRALHRDGWTVGVGSPFPSLGQTSRWASRSHVVPAAETSVAALIAAVNAAVDEERYELVFSPDDAGVLALSRHRDELRARVPFADHDVLVRALDKLELTRAAEHVGIGVPRTIEATDAALATWVGPVVVKPRVHTRLLEGAPGRLEAVIAADAETAAVRCAELRAHRAEPILQEVVTGTLVALALIVDRSGRIVARVQQRSEHSYPRDVGVTARGHTVPVDPQLSERAEALLHELGWFGLAQLRFLDPGAGRPLRLLDLNGRFYGSLALAVAAGVNLPAIWARLATERPVPDGVQEARPGVRFQWLARDLRWAVDGGGFGSFARVVETAAMAPRAAHSVWRPNDPWPAISFYGGKFWRIGRAWLGSRLTRSG